jgi:uncharacterized protein YdhG (YjbR/CyaY superfamily)
MPKKFLTVQEYINSFPPLTRKKLVEIRRLIRKNAPGAEEGFSYGVPAFKLNGNYILYAGFKNHVGFYPTPSAMQKFEKELALFDTSKGTVRFPIDKPLPIDLIAKIVKFRVLGK